MWYEWISKTLAAAGTQLAAIGAAIAAVVSAIAYHQHKVGRAEKAGKKDGAAIERDRIRTDTERATEYLERKADEIEDQVRRVTATDDDLRQRMRDASSDSSAK